MKVTEENYVDLLRKHQENALDYFMDHHGWMIKSIIHKHLFGYPDACDECMNDVFLSIWEHIDSYDEIKGSFTNWAAAIAKYKAISYIRVRSKAVQFENIDELEIESPENVAGKILEWEAQKEFLSLIRCLNQEDQRLFIKYFLEEKDSDEISTEMGIKREVVYNRLSRGKKKVKRTMERRCLD